MPTSFAARGIISRKQRACSTTGCGPGHLLPHLADAGYRVVGADIAMSVMGDVQARLATAPGFEGIHTVDDLLSRNDAFDAIFLLEVVESI